MRKKAADVGDADVYAGWRSVKEDGRKGDVNRPAFALFSDATGVGTVRRGARSVPKRILFTEGGLDVFQG